MEDKKAKLTIDKNLTDEDRAAKRQILQQLAGLGVVRCEMEYHGEDGLASFHPCVATDKDDEHVIVPDEVDCMVGQFVGRVLRDGWADELGGFGTATFEVDSGKVVFDHRVIEAVEFPELWEV